MNAVGVREGVPGEGRRSEGVEEYPVLGEVIVDLPANHAIPLLDSGHTICHYSERVSKNISSTVQFRFQG